MSSGRSSYVPLWVKSNFSFLEGASHPEDLVEQAARHGLPAMVMTDRDGVYGLVRAHMSARQGAVQLILGAQVSVGSLGLVPVIERPRTWSRVDDVMLLARDRQGYGRICTALSTGRARCPKGFSLLTPQELREVGQHEGVIAVCPSASLLPELLPSFGDRLYALVVRHRQPDDRARERDLRETAAQLAIPLVGGNEVLYHTPARRPLQDVLTCIRTGTTLSTAGRFLRANAEHDLKTPLAMHELFIDAPQLLTKTLEIAERCHFSLDDLRYVYPGEAVPDGSTEKDWLRNLTFEGAHGPDRYGEVIPDDVRAQIDRELDLITELDYGGYFLTMWEIVQFCRREGILCQGRGSAANSAVCYCLGITAVDPVRMDLLFERFLSRERAEPPDIDLDIEHERREEVIQWVYDRYGRRHAAMVANFIRFRARSAIRDVGKVLGLPQVALDRLAKLLGHHGAGVDAATMRTAGLDPDAHAHAHVLRMVSEILDFPRHLSIHPGGFILGSDPVDTMVPIEPATMENRTVIQWDKYDVEDLGLFKVDLLGLGALTQIRKALALINARRDDHRFSGMPPLTMATIPPEDPPTYELISRGDTVGVFQIESRAQMAMLPRLQPRCFYDLVIEVAIVRPGPIQGDMVHPYLRRRSGEETVEYPHPALERVLKKTLGVPIFQEQVMKLAVAVADYTPGEADQLRRDMAAWRSSGRIEQHHDRLISRMVAQGLPLEFAERVFAQIRGFGEYGFPESHAASFALIAYVTAWLRTHHPAIFSCSLLNAQPMGFYSPATLVEDARRRGVEVRPIDAKYSAWDCALEPGIEGDAEPAIRMGFRYIKGLGERERLELESTSHQGTFVDLEDFVRRSGLGRKALLGLAETGAFEGFRRDFRVGEARRDALWAVRELLAKRDDELRLVGGAGSKERPRFPRLGQDEAVFWDYRTAVHSARGHPMQSLRPELDHRGLPDAMSLNELPNGRRTRFVGMVICRQRPSTAAGVTFYTLEDETGFVNLVVWKQIFERHHIIARTAILMGVTGRIQKADGVVHFVADELWEPKLDLRVEARSRDFH